MLCRKYAAGSLSSTNGPTPGKPVSTNLIKLGKSLSQAFVSMEENEGRDSPLFLRSRNGLVTIAKNWVWCFGIPTN